MIILIILEENCSVMAANQTHGTWVDPPIVPGPQTEQDSHLIRRFEIVRSL